ncbi:T9SS type A sorting domain-containing protein, partial [bacterium]|nr:T9SS type A sorting domain-containing protein [bacterium]
MMKRGINGLILILLIESGISCTAHAQPVDSRSAAVNLVTTELFPQGTDEVILYVWGPITAGTRVAGLRGTLFTAPEDGYVVYIDDHPAASHFHPVRYSFVYSSDGKIQTTSANSPPLNLQDYHYVKTAIGEVLSKVTNRRPAAPDSPSPQDHGSRWAILMNGGLNAWANYPRYWNDLANIYVTLNWVYGFADERIIVLCSDGLDPEPDQPNGESSPLDLDADGDDDIMLPCNYQSLVEVFDSLAAILTNEDLLFIFATDHGSTSGGWNAAFNLWMGDEITDAEFAALVQQLPECNVICTFEPCYSGGFLDDLAVHPGPIIASSACRHDEPSYAMPPDYMYDTYVFHWTAAITGYDAYGAPVDADYNGDDQITMDEAFTYAELHDLCNENPQYAEYPLGIGALTSLWPAGPPPEVSINLHPVAPPITIPATGGEFEYIMEIDNNGDATAVFNCWVDVTFPYGLKSDPILGPMTILLEPGTSVTRTRTQGVPACAQSGPYWYNAYVGVSASRIYDMSSFPFSKLARIDIANEKHENLHGWVNDGEPLDDFTNLAPKEAVHQQELTVSVSPNPFNPTTTISFNLPVASNVKLEVFHISGSRVRVGLAPIRWYNSGCHSITFDGSNLPSGIYLYNLQIDAHSQTGKM